jgi:hypothetical protein
VVVRKDKEVGTFEVSGEDNLWDKMEERWGIRDDQYRLTPMFDIEKSGASYSAVLRIQGGKIRRGDVEKD